MPIYEYECMNCHHHFDLLQKISDEPIKECPRCFDNSARRLISAVGFQLKGSGWYATDFKNKKSPNTAKETEKASPGKEGTVEPKKAPEKSKDEMK